MRKRPRRAARGLFGLAALCAALSALAQSQSSAEDEREHKLEQRVEELAEELQAVRAELQALKAQKQAPAAALATQIPQAPARTAQNLSLWGYGEIYYARPTQDARRTEFDLARAVFGIGYQFDERTLFNSEYEVEHAVTSAADAGELEVEQFYVDRMLSARVGVRAGLILIPFGLLNEYHEPTNFYGVQRNFVETLIIPSTWREGGVALHGATEFGLAWNAGVTSDQDLAKWNFAPRFPPYLTALELEDSNVAPLQATHQELALANGRHLAQYASLTYGGIPAFTAGASLFTGKLQTASLAPPATFTYDPRLTLWETHVRWMPGNFDIAALYAHGAISQLAAINAANPGSANPIPSTFLGYYAQIAYSIWSGRNYRIAPFVRWEHYDMGASYAGVDGPALPNGLIAVSTAAGDLGRWPQGFDRVWTFGANYYLGPHLVLKADYQAFQVNSDFSRYDLGLGLNF